METKDPKFEADKKFQIRCTIIELLSLEDLDSGGSQCPDFALIYSINLYYAFAENTDSTSYKDFKSYMIQPRNKFLMSFKFPGMAHTEHKALSVAESIVTDEENRFFPGILGTYMSFNLRVVVTG